ncbi:MAG: phosphodiesterase [Thermoplasmata archaeon]|nr:MAG: phosphodiesterase [Thermoplasmata archaeon]
MKILAVADIHGSDRGAEVVFEAIEEHGPEIVCVAGDITHFGPPEWAEKFLNSIRVKTYAIHGNCDPPEVQDAINRSRAINLHHKVILEGEYAFVGFGGENYSVIPLSPEITSKVIIVLAHQPPYGILDTAMNGRHIGNRGLSSFIEKYSPALVISAHVHEARGVEKDENTTYVNPGEARKGYYALINIEGRRTDIELLRRLI